METSGVADGQIPFAFPHAPALSSADFLPHPGVRLALDLLAPAVAWPQRRLVLWGGPGTGKTHLLHIWASDNGASVVAGPRLVEPFWPEGPVSIDDADRVPSEQTLLHVMNAAAEAGCPLLLTMSRSPARATIRLPDLGSRLRATISAEIGPQDDAFLAALFAKLLAERQLPVAAPVQRWLLTRLPRTPAALREAVVRLDYAALAAQSGVSRPLAAAALADLLLDDTIQEPPE